MALEAERQREIGARIKELREGLHLPQPVVAERVGVTLRAYQKWEQGKGIAWEHFVKLVEVLGTTEDYLLNGPAEDQPGTESQLDRIEDKIDRLLAAVAKRQSPAEVAEQAAQRREAQQREAGASPRGKKGSGRAA